MLRYGMLIVAVVTGWAIGLAAQAPRQGGAGAAPQSPAHEVDPAITAFLKPVEPAQGDDELTAKLKERHNAAVRLLDLRVKEYQRGVNSLTPAFDSARAVVEAKMDLAQSDEDRQKVAQQTLDVSKVIEAQLQKQADAGFGSQADLERARLARLTAEVELLKLKHPKAAPTTRQQ